MSSMTIDYSIPLSQGWELAVGTIALDASYDATNGDALDPSNVSRVERVTFQPGPTTAQGTGRIYEWNSSTQAIFAKYFDYDAGADGIAITVPNATDLSAVTNLPFTALVQY